MATLRQANEVLLRLANRVTDTQDLRHATAKEIASTARKKAGGRPTPQARGVASALSVKGGTALVFPGRRVTLSGRSVRAGLVSFGSEFGSDQFSQFPPRTESGHWLNPAAQETDVLSVGDVWLDNVLDAAIGSAR